MMHCIAFLVSKKEFQKPEQRQAPETPFSYKKLEKGLEPSTPSLRVKCSTD